MPTFMLRLAGAHWRGATVVAVICLLAAASLWSGCNALPSLDGRSRSLALPDTETADSRLARATSTEAQAHPGQSGVLMLADGREAFATRMLLAEAAERSLDVQVYIWHGDLTAL